jgi:hypothetical protein
MRKKYFEISLIVLAAFVFGSCMSEEKFDTAAGDKLAFSKDTIKLDTVLAGVETATKYFMIYNPNSDGISITDVSFEGGINNGFRVNVDGMYINNGLTGSIDCRKKDSLRAFVELTPQLTNIDDPVKTSAILVFTLANGMKQKVVLTARIQDVVVLRGLHIKKDTILSARRPYLIYDSLTVEEGATLTLAEGTRYYFHSNTGLRVDGSLHAVGTLQNPVVLRGDRTDLMFVNQPYDRISNQWKGVHFTKSSYDNHLNYCDIHSGFDGIVCDSSDVTKDKLRLENSIVHNMAGDCLRAMASKIFIGNSQITNAAGNCVNICGGDADFIHCTIANFYPFSALRGASLHYSNEYHQAAYPIVRAYFRNCIITGYSQDEIMGEQSEKFQNAAFNYGFYNCLLNTPEIKNDDKVEKCFWDNESHKVCREGNFPKFNEDALIFGFGLVAKSAAIGIGDIAVTGSYYPYDRLGVSRLSDGQSDAGCYEYVASK